MLFKSVSHTQATVRTTSSILPTHTHCNLVCAPAYMEWTWGFRVSGARCARPTTVLQAPTRTGSGNWVPRCMTAAGAKGVSVSAGSTSINLRGVHTMTTVTGHHQQIAALRCVCAWQARAMVNGGQQPHVWLPWDTAHNTPHTMRLNETCYHPSWPTNRHVPARRPQHTSKQQRGRLPTTQVLPQQLPNQRSPIKGQRLPILSRLTKHVAQHTQALAHGFTALPPVLTASCPGCSRLLEPSVKDGAQRFEGIVAECLTWGSVMHTWAMHAMAGTMVHFEGSNMVGFKGVLLFKGWHTSHQN